MTGNRQQRLGKALWGIANNLRGAMNADDFRDYMLSFLFLRYLSDNYEDVAEYEMGDEYPATNGHITPLQRWYNESPEGDIKDFETMMRRRVHYVIKPDHLWGNIASMARRQDDGLLDTLREGFKYIENESFENTFRGLFSEINLESDKLGKDHAARNAKLCTIITKIAEGLDEFSTELDTLGDAYEYLIGEFAAGSGKKAGEFYTPQKISDILSRIVALDSQDPPSGARKRRGQSMLDFSCGSGSLLLNARRHIDPDKTDKKVGIIHGQESNITTYNLARMNMLLHKVQDSGFEIFHGDTLKNDWPILRDDSPTNKALYDVVVANPPFSLRWEHTDALADDARFKGYGVAPRSAADFAFLLHGLHHLKDDGTMAIILPHGVLFRGGAEARIREKLLEDGNIDAVIGLPANLFYSTGIPVCILILKKCVRQDNLLFINASEHYKKIRRQNSLTDEHIDKIVDTYQHRKEEKRYARRVPMDEIRDNGHNLNITRYVSTAKPEEPIDLGQVHKALQEHGRKAEAARKRYNKYLKELGLSELPK